MELVRGLFVAMPRDMGAELAMLSTVVLNLLDDLFHVRWPSQAK